MEEVIRHMKKHQHGPPTPGKSVIVTTELNVEPNQLYKLYVGSNGRHEVGGQLHVSLANNQTIDFSGGGGVYKYGHFGCGEGGGSASVICLKNSENIYNPIIIYGGGGGGYYGGNGSINNTCIGGNGTDMSNRTRCHIVCGGLGGNKCEFNITNIMYGSRAGDGFFSGGGGGGAIGGKAGKGDAGGGAGSSYVNTKYEISNTTSYTTDNNYIGPLIKIEFIAQPIDCIGSFVNKGVCSKTCGPGDQEQEYKISQPAEYGGASCSKNQNDKRTIPCNLTPCPIDCIGSYGEFNECSATCGGGTKTKTYKITTQAQYGGKTCPISPPINETCNTHHCPIDCIGSYGEFSECSSTCGGGTKTKTYKITTQAQYGGETCPISPPINETCNTHPCPIDCIGSYGEFSECSSTCGGGTKTKTYEITTQAQYGGETCPISPPINETCNTHPCPIDCIGYFITTEKCSKECDNGKETIKYVISQEGKNGGKECEYTDGYTDRVDCNTYNCINELDTPYYKSFKPLEYNKDRAYYWRRDKLVEEGIRRNKDDLKQIHKLQTLFENETNEEKKKELQYELDLYKWRDSILETKDKNTGLSRDKRDIITDYYPEEIGQHRVWIERHSHIPDYSY